MEENIENLKITDIIKSAIVFLERNDYESLHLIENNTLEQAIVNFNKDYSEICVMLYGLRKLISKKHISQTNSWANYKISIVENLNSALNVYREEDPSKFNNYIKNIIELIKKADHELGRYVSVVIDDGRVKLASTAYAYGLSASQSSDLLSITKEQLMSYVGITKMPDEDKQFKSINERVHLLEVMAEKDKGDKQ
ncbi:hypothetical protein GW835_01175 [archaeon]|jgi:hypothetical protein|nr:hypothetical protein [archaeon]NCP79164.1 hypothetical protein [archaeon]NCP97889.1 hypothetical protein [archaeon]NCQ06931.1 hypothetical protein [archaeon]NCQ50727.1 hypothetical protein [archaeon]